MLNDEKLKEKTITLTEREVARLEYLYDIVWTARNSLMSCDGALELLEKLVADEQ